MLQRDSFFGNRTEKPPEHPQKNPAVSDFGTPAAQVRAALTGTPAAGEDARKNARDAAAAPKAEGQQGSRLIVGPNIKLKGVEITDCDTLIVEGHVEATMDSRVIEIASQGTFSGTAGIDLAEIRGGFSGELTVRKCLTVHATGKVSGNIRYGKLVIEEGGEISGDVRRLSEEEKAVRIQHAPAVIKPGAAQSLVARN